MKFIYTLVCLIGITSTSYCQTVAQQVQDAQVTIRAGDHSGSGTLITTSDGTTWVLSCGHLFDSVRTEREVSENGSKRVVIEFSPAKIYKTLSDGKQDTGKIELLADVVRYSDPIYGEDLSLLKIRQRGTLKQTTKFYLEETPPTIDTEVYHCGSLRGDAGSNSLTTGVVSKIGRLYTDGKGREKVYDQTTATALPGSSGGPVCLKKDGRYVGCLVRGSGETFNLMVPTRRIQVWAKEVGIDFILDPTKKVPTDEELKKKPIEPHGNITSKGGSSFLDTNYFRIIDNTQNGSFPLRIYVDK